MSAPTAAEDADAAARPVISAPKTVLIVDDEPAVTLAAAADAAPSTSRTTQVATVGNGQEAIEYLNAYPVEVLVTDIVMPVKSTGSSCWPMSGTDTRTCP
jgi:CheY-like chemotaxis protein